jgi:hypothetical protein
VDSPSVKIALMIHLQNDSSQASHYGAQHVEKGHFQGQEKILARLAVQEHMLCLSAVLHALLAHRVHLLAFLDSPSVKNARLGLLPIRVPALQHAHNAQLVHR